MESRSISLGRCDYAWYEIPARRKPKLLLLHGMMVESHSFNGLIEHLRGDFHLLLLDLKGHGKSGNGESYDEDYRPPVIAEELHSFYEQVISEPFFLLGYSLGGQYAIQYAGSHPETLRGLILLDSAPEISLKSALKILFSVMTTPNLFRGPEDVRRFYDKKSPGFGDYMLEHAMVQDKYGYYSPRYDKKNLAPRDSRKTGERSWGLWQAAKKITAPTLILRAGQSSIIDDEMEVKLREHIAKLDVVRMEGMGHHLGMTHPADVAQEISNFRKGLARYSPRTNDPPLVASNKLWGQRHSQHRLVFPRPFAAVEPP